MPRYRSTPKSEPLVKIKGHYQGGVKLSEYVKAVRSQYNKQVVEWTKSTDHMVVKKPERTFGAVWMDDFVALEKSVSVCGDCQRKYGVDLKRLGYIPQSMWKERTDCDGCSQSLRICTGYFHYSSQEGKLIRKLKGE